MLEKRIVTQSKWNAHLEHSLYKQGSDTLMVLLGGQQYSVDKPLLHYSRNLGLQMGLDVLAVHYGFSHCHGLVKFPDDFETLYEEVEALIEMVLEPEHEKIVFIGKSLGTVLIKRLHQSFANRSHKLVYLTPVAPAFDPDNLSEKLIIMGTGDSHYDEKLLNREEESVVIEFEGADHSLETGDVIADLELLEQVMGAISGYLEKV